MEKQCIKAHCGCDALSGAVVCAFHWAESNWGIEWASHCHPNHPDAKAFCRTSTRQYRPHPDGGYILTDIT